MYCCVERKLYTVYISSAIVVFFCTSTFLPSSDRKNTILFFHYLLSLGLDIWAQSGDTIACLCPIARFNSQRI